MTEGLASTTKKLTHIGTVLVPTDFSGESHRALRYALALVRELRANLHVVHVGEIDFAVPGPARPGGKSAAFGYLRRVENSLSKVLRRKRREGAIAEEERPQ